MCGIAGILDVSQNTETNKSVLQKMLQIQHHRGPDATGYWSDGKMHLGHNRLSIIDLSEAGNQPMHYRNFTLIYNGEVYNYVELKNELAALGHRFENHSDSEVILHAFAEWGESCVTRFVGMWSFVIWDSEKAALFASRDRFGIKPFNYIYESGRLYLASELKTLKATPVFRGDVNLRQISRGIQMGWLGYREETYYECIKALPAAHNMTLKDGKLTISRYWDIQTGTYSSLNFDQKCKAFYELFCDSVRIHMRSDVPVASCLSGGLDSSAIVSMIQEQNPGKSYKSFSIYYEGEGDVDERPFISEVIKKYPSIEPHYYSPSLKDVESEFHKALYHADVPVTGSSFLSQYFLMKLIAGNGIKVVLDGQGSDEYLAGYMHSFYRLIGGMIRRMEWGSALLETNSINSRLGNTGLRKWSHLGKSVLSSIQSEQSLYALEYSNYYPFMVQVNDSPPPFELRSVEGTRLDQFLYHLLFHTSLPSLLHYEDRNSMAFSIESRVPFLDHRLVEFCFGLMDDDKIHRTETKYILRESLRKILPEAIYSRKDKKGFVTPGESKWLRGPLKFLLENLNSMPDFIHQKKASELYKQYLAGDNSKSTLIWRLATLGEWTKMG